MRCRAPGKVVLSGAYAVLRGAPAVVTAVDRYAVADDALPPEFVTPEVRWALEELGEDSEAPWFDASALRDRSEKLGLGSSAAILVASLGVLRARAHDAGTEAWRDDVYRRALRAHRGAQGGGSGVDVAAAAFGGTFLARLGQPDGTAGTPDLDVTPVALPPDLHLEVWAMGRPASTADFVRRVFALEKADPAAFERLLGAQSAAAHRAAEAAAQGDGAGFLAGLRAQYQALIALGDAARVPIVVGALRSLEPLIEPSGALLPAGAGGGDISIYAGAAPSSPMFRAAAEAQGLWLLDARAGAPGLQLLPSPAP